MDEKIVMKRSDDDDVGYILEVDLDYPKNYMIYIKAIH